VAIEKLHRIAREKEALRSEHRLRHEEEAKFLRRTKLEEELKRAQREGVLNNQPLAVRLSPYSSSSLECAKGNKEKIQFVHI
jgi:hypothetical protein